MVWQEQHSSKQMSTPDTPSIKELMDDMKRGRLAIPDFQRSFVWDPADTQKLLVSIIARYPAGTLLFWEQKDPQIKYRSFEGFNGNLKGSATLVLDGQQRLTSIFQALAGVGQQRFYVDLNLLGTLDSEAPGLLDASRLDDVIVYRDLTARSTRRRPPTNAIEEIRQSLFPLSLIDSELIEEWLDVMEDALEGEDWKERRNKVRQLVRRYLRPIGNYRFPVVELPETTPLDAVCRIFETINRTGVKLSVFELLAARFWPAGVDLRQAWDEARRKHPILPSFEIDAYYLLQAVSLRATWEKSNGARASAQRSDVLELTPEQFAKYWDEVAQGASRALKFLRDECGVLAPKWLPYSMLLVPLAAVWHEVESKRSAEKGSALQKIRRFFWCSVFSRNYDQGGNSQAGKDYTDLSSWLNEGDKIPEAVDGFSFAGEVLDTARTNLQALYKGVIAITLSSGARDFHSGSNLTPEKILEESIDAHHIFPKKYLEENGDPGNSELILNRALIDKRTNQSIGKRSPSEYLATMEEALGEEEVIGILQSHLLPAERNSPLRHDNYGAFLLSRKALVVKAIASVTSE